MIASRRVSYTLLKKDFTQMNRHELSKRLTMIGGGLLGLGIFLLLVRLIMELAWIADFIALAGLVLLAAGLLMRGGIRR
jgi:hypothetical protein